MMAERFHDMMSDISFSASFYEKYRKQPCSLASIQETNSSHSSSIYSDDSAYFSNPPSSHVDEKTEKEEPIKSQTFAEINHSCRSYGTETPLGNGFFSDVFDKQVHSTRSLSFPSEDYYRLESEAVSMENQGGYLSHEMGCSVDSELDNPSYSDYSAYQIETEADEEDSKFQYKKDYWKPKHRMKSPLNDYYNSDIVEGVEYKRSNISRCEDRNEKKLKPSLEYFKAPIFPYVQKNYLNEEKRKAAQDIRNVVTRQYGQRMQEAVQRIDKSLSKIRKHQSNKHSNEIGETCRTKDSKTFNGSHLTQLMTVRSNRKFRARINDLIEQRTGSSGGSLNAVLELSVGAADELEQIIGQQDIIIEQAKKALEVCQTEKKFTKSIMLTEIERVILKATVTKEIIDQHKREDRPFDPEDNSGFIRISNIRIRLKKYVTPKDMTSYFVCILHCGKDVYCSNLTNSKKKKLLELPDAYLFKELPSDSKIVIKIYVIHSNAGYKRSFCDLVRNCGLLLKSFITRPTTEPKEEGTTSFELCGEFLLKKELASSDTFLLEALLDQNKFIENFQYDIKSGVDLKYELSGNLFVCFDAKEGDWKRHWCELEGHQVKMWESLDFKDQPKVSVDLSRSLLPRVVFADKEIGSRKKSLHLRIKRELDGNVLHQDIFLANDNQAALLNWKIKMNIVLLNLQNWGCMKL